MPWERANWRTKCFSASWFMSIEYDSHTSSVSCSFRMSLRMPHVKYSCPTQRVGIGWRRKFPAWITVHV